MLPGIFQVEQLSSLDLISNIWKGSDTELSLRKPLSRKRKRGGNLSSAMDGSGPGSDGGEAPAPDVPELPATGDEPEVQDLADDEADAVSESLHTEGSDPEAAGEPDDLLEDFSEGDEDEEQLQQRAAGTGLLEELGLEFVRDPSGAELHFPLGNTAELRYNLVGQFFVARCLRHDGCRRQLQSGTRKTGWVLDQLAP